MSRLDQPPASVRAFYDTVAREYAEHFADELADKPLDRALLERFAADLGGTGPVYDLGCGPGGQTTAFLHALGVDVRGMDLSPAAVAEASRRHPHVPFETGDMLALPLADGSAAGIVAFYSIVTSRRTSCGRPSGRWRACSDRARRSSPPSTRAKTWCAWTRCSGTG